MVTMGNLKIYSFHLISFFFFCELGWAAKRRKPRHREFAHHQRQYSPPKIVLLTSDRSSWCRSGPRCDHRTAWTSLWTCRKRKDRFDGSPWTEWSCWKDGWAARGRASFRRAPKTCKTTPVSGRSAWSASSAVFAPASPNRNFHRKWTFPPRTTGCVKIHSFFVVSTLIRCVGKFIPKT